jgi:hypothetical protein
MPGIKTIKERIEEVIKTYDVGDEFFTHDFKGRAYDMMGKYTPHTNSISLRLKMSPYTTRIGKQTWRRI